MDDEITTEEQQNQPSTGASAEPEPTRISLRKVLESISTLRLEKERIKPLESDSWGKGGNADVIQAELLPANAPEPSSSGDVQHIAVKKLKLDGDADDTRTLASLVQEISLLNKLSHKNIVKVIGFVESTSDGIAWIIFPWEQNGNLREFVASADWEFPERIALIHDFADGMKYLHSREPPICHGDLKSLNVLVNSKNEAVIIDFGSARSVESTSKEIAQPPDIDAISYVNLDQPKVEVVPSGGTITLTAAQWTLRWAAPELLAGGVSDLMSDIWAFGWICWL